jgi:hypothetical protein
MAFFIDAHCHPPLKHFLFGHSPVKKGHATQDSNYTNIQVTVPAMQKGGLHVVLAAHYLPEKQIKDDWKMIDASKPVKKFMEKYSDKLEREDAFAQTLSMIDAFEEEFAEAEEAAVAHNIAELEQHLDRQKKFLFIPWKEPITWDGAFRWLTTTNILHNSAQKGWPCLPSCTFIPTMLLRLLKAFRRGKKSSWACSIYRSLRHSLRLEKGSWRHF